MSQIGDFLSVSLLCAGGCFLQGGQELGWGDGSLHPPWGQPAQGAVHPQMLCFYVLEWLCVVTAKRDNDM